MLRNVQALRGLACLFVVLYHVAGWEQLVWPRIPVFGFYRYFGFAGVDLFFVLSGFIITHAHWKQIGQPRHLPTYLYRRLSRIYPVYWLALGLT
ncbi:MAG: acyltransferase family protein, partial [Gemmataceae bacterium]